jgi:hypothetical protein
MLFRDILFAAAQSSGGVVYNPDAVTYFTAAEGAGATFAASTKLAISNLITGLQTDSLWTKMDALWLYAQDTAIGALLDIKSLRTATAVSAPTFTAFQGYAGNGTTSYVDTTFNLATHGVQYTLNSGHISVYNRTARTSAGSISNIGAVNSGTPLYTQIYCYFDSSGAKAGSNINDAGTGPFTTAAANASGFWVASRTASNAQALYRNGSSHHTSAGVSTSVPNLALYVGGRNNNGVFDQATTDQHAAASIGAGLDATEAANFNTRVEAYMDAVGAGVQ